MEDQPPPVDARPRLSDRRWFGPLVGALAAGVLATIYVVATDPFTAGRNEAYDTGRATGFVLRSVVLGIFAGGLAEELVRGARPWHWVALAAVLALLVVPPIFEREDEDDRAEKRERSFRAGFIDGCTDNAPRPTCECVYDDLASQGYDSDADFSRLQAQGRFQAVVQAAGARCEE